MRSVFFFFLQEKYLETGEEKIKMPKAFVLSKN